MIEIKNLKYRYPTLERFALSDLTLKIGKGEFAVITGRSGCGKTTLFRCLSGLIPHFYGGKLNGTVKIGKLKVQDHSVSEISQHVGYVFQNPENQLFSSTCKRDVAFGLENLALPPEEIQERVNWALSSVNASDLADRMPHKLSSGQQQKIAIATVLAMRPEIILLDEPTSFLDPSAAKDLMNLLRKLNLEFNITLLVAEHRLELVSKYADRILVMADGRIIEDGTPRKIFSNPQIALEIGVPKVARLHRILMSEGLASPPLSVSEEEFSTLLRRMFS